MTQGLSVWICRGCNASYFPERLICPSCGSGEFGISEIDGGQVEDVTVVTHVLGQENWQPRTLATVRIEGGQRIIAGTIGEIAVGDAPPLRALAHAGIAPSGRYEPLGLPCFAAPDASARPL